MQSKKTTLTGFGTAVIMLLLIMDAKTALTAASEGIELCIRTVIPSLFPFFLLSSILTSCFIGQSPKAFRWIGRICRIPDGAEYLLIIGLCGGYPVGAQNISSAYSSRGISKQDAERMLAFCNNAGPAFIFGMTSLMFPSFAVPWAIWAIQILCALITGMFLPARKTNARKIQTPSRISPAQAMNSALKAMASVCGWVIVFRIIISILDRWLLWMIPEEISIMISGLLELANGCMLLNSLNNLAWRFITATIMTVFGGFCVYLQTISVCGQLSGKLFILGKFMQSVIAVPLSLLAAGLLFPGNIPLIYAGILLLSCITTFIIIKKIKIHTGNSVMHSV